MLDNFVLIGLGELAEHSETWRGGTALCFRLLCFSVGKFSLERCLPLFFLNHLTTFSCHRGDRWLPTTLKVLKVEGLVLDLAELLNRSVRLGEAGVS